MKLALLGYPLKHTLSPFIFEKIFKAAGIEGSYHAIEVPSKRLFYHLVPELLSSGYAGLNVTIPYKVDAFTIADEKSEIVKRTLSANFLYMKDLSIVAENTDYFGLKESLEELEVDSKNAACVIGYGGAARTCLTLFSDLGFKSIYVIARNPEKAKVSLKEVVKKLTSKVFVVSEVSEIIESLDLLVNASPAGMHPKIKELPHGFEALQKVSKKGAVLDLIYNPRETVLLAEAKKKGLKTMNGLKMLIVQAVKAFEIIDDKKIDAEFLMRQVEEKV